MGAIDIEVITVVRNDPDGLTRTIESVRQQSYANVNQIVIDGASNDDRTPKVLEKYASIVGLIVSEPDEGIYDAMNKGMSYAKDESYIVFLNAGDIFADNDSLSQIIQGVPSSADAFYGNIYVKESDDRLVRHAARKFDFDTLLSFGTGVVCHQAFFIKKSFAPEYNKAYQLKAELDWYFEILEQKPDLQIAHIDRAVVIFDKGGAGYQKFITNRLEWLRVVRRRYGLRAISDSGLLLYLLKNSKYRYPWVERIPLYLQFFQGIALLFKLLTRPLAPAKLPKH